ncbi:carbohydrate kinase family protein [Thalassoglobus sp.]|uniref:carbohydrate kinase family protein n=1 Tax=Thalassoglobus sp. TaxID=2795869 RepID=UPI003AA94BED
MTPTAPKILGIGTVTVDHVMTVSDFPAPDTKNEAISTRFQVGGPVPIALAQLSRFGHSTNFLSAWGDDPFGNLVEERFKAEGIAFSPACRGDFATSVTQIWLKESTGQRTLVTSRTHGAAITELLTAEFVSQFDVLHLDCWPSEAALLAARFMKENGGFVCVDTGSPKAGVEEILRIADVVNCPKRFCEIFLNVSDLEEASRRVSTFGPKIVTVTDGENGSVLHTQGETFHQPALKFGNIVDTNGAGDSFSGAIIHGVLQNWPPEKVLKFAATCAGLKCTQAGNDAALPNEVDVLQRMNAKVSSET